MAFSWPTVDELFREWLDGYPTDKDKSEGSEPWRLGRALVNFAAGLVARFRFFDRERLPDLATEARLTRWGTIYRVPRRGPTLAQGTQALRVTGVPGTPVPSTPPQNELAHSDGTRFHVASTGVVIGGSGEAIVDIAADTPGLVGNKISGEQLQFVAPPAGVIDSAATLVKDLSGGLDNEGEEEYRQRLLKRIGDPPQGGAIADWEQWTLGTPTLAVETAYVYPLRRGLGTVDVAGLLKGTGQERVIADLAPIAAYIEPRRPATMRDYEVLVTVPVQQDVVVAVQSADEKRWVWDWLDGGVGYAVTAFNAAAKTLTVPSLPAVVGEGDRITVRGEQALVVTRVGNVLTLATWFSFAPVVGDEVRAGGDLVEPVRAAIRAQFAMLGPARGDYAGYDWDDTLRLSRIYGAIVPTAAPGSGVAGVRDAQVITPVANVTPADLIATSDPNRVELLVPGRIEVRRLY
jgi:uncharacterized phage protein gp47/JayE